MSIYANPSQIELVPMYMSSPRRLSASPSFPLLGDYAKEATEEDQLSFSFPPPYIPLPFQEEKNFKSNVKFLLRVQSSSR